MNRNNILTLLEEYFLDDIEIFTMECVGDFTSDELSIFTEYLVDYAKLDVIDELKVTEVESEREEAIEIVNGEMLLNISVEGYAHWDGDEEYLGTEEVEICYKFCFEMIDGKVASGIALEVLF